MREETLQALMQRRLSIKHQRCFPFTILSVLHLLRLILGVATLSKVTSVEERGFLMSAQCVSHCNNSSSNLSWGKY